MLRKMSFLFVKTGNRSASFPFSTSQKAYNHIFVKVNFMLWEKIIMLKIIYHYRKFRVIKEGSLLLQAI